MTRIVAGSLGGRRIAVPPGGTRPTAQRVREAMFSAIESRLNLADVRVLDCYAGSGALGIEALSRGGRYALFVESDRRSAAVLDGNLRLLGLAPARATVQTSTVETMAAHHPDEPYDLVLADPPYGLTNPALSQVLARLSGNGWIAPGGLIVVERPARSSTKLPWPQGVEEIASKRYGDTAVCYGRQA